MSDVTCGFDVGSSIFLGSPIDNVFGLVSLLRRRSGADRSSVFRRVQPDFNPAPPGPDTIWCVDLKAFNRRPSDGGQAKQDGKIIVPSEVIMPYVLPGIEQSDILPCPGIAAGLMGRFRRIAARTGQAQVVKS